MVHPEARRSTKNGAIIADEYEDEDASRVELITSANFTGPSDESGMVLKTRIERVKVAFRPSA
jgi:hypothetical protein